MHMVGVFRQLELSMIQAGAGSCTVNVKVNRISGNTKNTLDITQGETCIIRPGGMLYERKNQYKPS